MSSSSSGKVEDFELCHLSKRIQCLHCVRYSMRGIAYCDCSICAIPCEQARRLNKNDLMFLRHPFSPRKMEHTEGIVAVVQKNRSYIIKQNSGRRRPVCAWTPLQRKTTRLLRRLLNECDTTTLEEHKFRQSRQQHSTTSPTCRR